MCGFSLAINRKNEKVSPEFIKSLNDKVNHRGPDDEGYFFGDNFSLGHRRLSIIDLSKAGHQPMQWKDFWITYNGEIYNYIELKEELTSLGHSFHTTSDTEVILAAYDQWGLDSFAKLNGMWAFAIYDQQKNEIVLSRDHFGIKPLYFTSTESWFMAGSEIKQFTACSEFTAVLNKPVAVNFLVHGWLNYSDNTFFEGVSELRPGHSLVYDLKTHASTINKWYDLERAAVEIDDSYEEAVATMRKLFIDSVRIRMRSDVRVGSCLSGGIDSSSIVSVIHSEHLANDTFATVTSCYHDARYDEQKFSDTVSQQTGFRPLKVYPDLNQLLDSDDLDRMVYHQDQPFSTASHYSEFNVFKTARRDGIIVMQDGQGADEYLCGYPEFSTARIVELIGQFKWKSAASLISKKADHKQTSFKSQLYDFIRSAVIHKLMRPVKKITGRNYPWFNDRWKKIAAGAERRFERNNVRDLSIEEIKYSSIPFQLHSEDRNSMMFSLESRLPFLDHRLVEYGIGLPSSYRIKDGFTKAVLREAISELPEPIKYRKDKMGFVAPDALWVKQNKERVRAELKTVIGSTGIFTDELLNRFDRFIEGSLGYEPIYFRALTFSKFLKIFNVKIG